MLTSMVPDALVYKAADKLIEQHGGDAVDEATRLLSRALGRREQDRALVMLRVRMAVAALQSPPSSSVH